MWLDASYGLDESQQRTMISTLEQCNSLGDEFWLQTYPDTTLNPLLLEAIRGHALQTFLDPSSETTHATQASMILAFRGFEHSELEQQQINSALSLRLDSSLANNLLETTAVPASMADAAIPQHFNTMRRNSRGSWDSSSGRGSSSKSLRIREQESRAIIALELLELAAETAFDQTEIIREIADETQTACTATVGFLGGKSVELSWGSFKLHSYMSHGSSRSGPTSDVAPSEPKPSEWIGYFVNLQTQRNLQARSDPESKNLR